MGLQILAVAFVYAISIYFAPFPCWSTYILLWKVILFDGTGSIGVRQRLRQGLLLSRYALFAPLITCLWYLDELFFSASRKLAVRPVFIIGQPRSGTTFLHRTMARDTENFLAIRHIEWRYPFILVQLLLTRLRWVRSLVNRSYWPRTSAGKMASTMHPDNLLDWEEDGIFFEECFLHHFFVFLRFPYPDLLSYLDDLSMLPENVPRKMLDVHRRVIQKMMFSRGKGGEYFLSKEVTSHNKVPRLLKLYPEARFVVILRPSGEFMSSLMALMRYSTEAKTGVDPRLIPGWEEAVVARMSKDSRLLVRLCEEVVPKERQVRLVFQDLTTDVAASVEYIYDGLGMHLPASYREFLKSLNEKQRDHRRGYEYEKCAFKDFVVFDEFVQKVEGERSRSRLEDKGPRDEALPESKEAG